MTNQQLRTMENHIELQRQLKVIKKTKIMALTESCDNCNKVFVPMYRLNGYACCPVCDSEVIEEYKDKIASKAS